MLSDIIKGCNSYNLIVEPERVKRIANNYGLPSYITGVLSVDGVLYFSESDYPDAQNARYDSLEHFIDEGEGAN